MRGTILRGIVFVLLFVTLSSFSGSIEPTKAFRVQICRLTLYKPGNNFPAGYEALFDSYSETWVIRSSRFTKSRSEAQKMRALAIKQGYKDAFVIETILYLPKGSNIDGIAKPITINNEKPRHSIPNNSSTKEDTIDTNNYTIKEQPQPENNISLIDTFNRYRQS